LARRADDAARRHALRPSGRAARRERRGLSRSSAIHSAEETQPLHALRLRHADLSKCWTESACHPGLLVGTRLPHFHDDDAAVTAAAQVAQESLGPVTCTRTRVETQHLIDLRVQRRIAVDFDDDHFGHGTGPYRAASRP